MDIDALWRTPAADDDNSTTNDSDIDPRLSGATSGVASGTMRKPGLLRRASFNLREMPNSLAPNGGSQRRASLLGTREAQGTSSSLERAARAALMADENDEKPAKQLRLPTDIHHYHEKDWLEADIKKIRHGYVANGVIFPKYKEGMKSYFAKDWERAKKCFEVVLTQRDDGPSKYFLERMAEHDGVPPRNFMGYTIER